MENGGVWDPHCTGLFVLQVLHTIKQSHTRNSTPLKVVGDVVLAGEMQEGRILLPLEKKKLAALNKEIESHNRILNIQNATTVGCILRTCSVSSRCWRR